MCRRCDDDEINNYILNLQIQLLTRTIVSIFIIQHM